MEMSKILADIARAIVDDPDSVKVTETVEEDDITLVLEVAEHDTGKVIGHHGKIAKAIRSVMKVAAQKSGKHITVEIQ